MRNRILGIMAASILFAGSAFYAVSSKNACPLAGTADCPLVKECPLAGTDDCLMLAGKSDCCADKKR